MRDASPRVMYHLDTFKAKYVLIYNMLRIVSAFIKPRSAWTAASNLARVRPSTVPSLKNRERERERVKSRELRNVENLLIDWISRQSWRQSFLKNANELPRRFVRGCERENLLP